MTLVHALVAGADCIDDADLLRAGSSAQVLGHRVMAPSTLGTFLRSFNFGHVRRSTASPNSPFGAPGRPGPGRARPR